MVSYNATENNIYGLGFSANPLKERQDMQTHNVREESNAAPIIGTFAITQNHREHNFLNHSNIKVFSAPVKYVFIYTLSHLL